MTEGNQPQSATPALVREPRPMLQRLFAEDARRTAKTATTTTAAETRSGLVDRVAGKLLAELRQQIGRRWADAVPRFLGTRASLAALADGQLVRFRCLVQDNGYSPEIYPLSLLLDNDDVGAGGDGDAGIQALTGCFMDMSMEQLAQCPSEDRLLLADRFPYYAVSVPAQSEWLKQLLSDQAANMTMDAGAESLRGEKEQDAVAAAKHPLPWEREEAAGALLKTYQQADWLLNEAVEVIGILDKPAEAPSAMPVIHVLFYRPLVFSGGHPSFHSALAEDDESFHIVGDLKLQTSRDENQSLVSAPLERAHVANEKIWQEALAEHGGDSTSTLVDVRRALLQWLRDEVLFGDELAAEYVLVWLIGRIYKRATDMSLGQFSLTLADCPVVERLRNATHETRNQVVDRLNHAVGLLATHSVLLPLNLDLLNKISLPPKFSPTEVSFDEPAATENMGSVESGLLQLKSGTCLIVDETSMDAGQLLERGIRNLAALQQLLTFNTIQLESEQPLEINCEADIKCLVLSEGRKSLTTGGANNAANQREQHALLPTSTTLPWRPTQIISEKAVYEPINEHELLPLFRLYIAYVCIAGNASHVYSVPEELTAEIAREFSEQRKISREAGSEKFEEQYISDEDLLYRLGLARLLAVSHGKNALTGDMWTAMKRLEEARFQRLIAATESTEVSGM